MATTARAQSSSGSTSQPGSSVRSVSLPTRTASPSTDMRAPPSYRSLCAVARSLSAVGPVGVAEGRFPHKTVPGRTGLYGTGTRVLALRWRRRAARLPTYGIFDPRTGSGAVFAEIHATPDGPRYAVRKDFVHGEDVTIGEWTIPTSGLPRYRDDDGLGDEG